MLKRGTGKRLWWAVAIAALAVMAYTGFALAASPPIIGQVDDTYSAATYTIDQGEVAQLQVTGSDHNVTAHMNGPDNRALFRSPTISSGATGVDGTQFLAAGDYTFFCTIHPTTMQATLHVSGNGTPLARPSATAKLETKTVSKAVKKGLLVSVDASTQVSGATVTAKLGRATIARENASLASGIQNLKLNLSKSGKSKLGKLGKKSSAKLTVMVEIPFGAPAAAKAKLK
jgi:plastocyanin